jgi:hypothetical protein
MTYTLDTLVAMAGPDFTWSGTVGGQRPTASARAPFREYLHAAQGGLCLSCGRPVDQDRAEFMHRVSRGPDVRGFFPGNIAIGHKSCNSEDAEKGPIANWIREDLIVSEWPGMSYFTAITKNRKAGLA